MVLYEAYVRSHLTFAAATWAPRYLEAGKIAGGRCPLSRMSIEHRRGIHILLRLGPDLSRVVIYIATVRWPLEVALAKAVVRYYKRVESLVGLEGSGPAPV